MSVERRSESSPKAGPMSDVTSPHDRELLLQRTYDAPLELVWSAWTDAALLDRWWGPRGFRNETSAMDFRVGGVWRFLMHEPDGKVWKNWICYDEISPLSRLAYAHGGESDEPEFHVVITFERQGAATWVTMRSVFPTAAALAELKKSGAVEGGQQTLERLSQWLPELAGDIERRSLIASRVFDAPGALVWRAFSEAEHLSRWWGPKGFTDTTTLFEFRVGGRWHHVMHGPNGATYPNESVFVELMPPSRVVLDHVSPPKFRLTFTIAEEKGGTRVTMRQTFARLEDRERMKPIAEQANHQNLEKLEAVVGSLR